MTEEYGALHESAGAKPSAFVYEEHGEIFVLPVEIAPGLQQVGRVEVKSTYGYGGPVSSSQDRGFLGRACDFFESAVADLGAESLHLRLHPVIGNHALILGEWLPQPDRITVGLDLTLSCADIRLRMHQKHRNAVSKAERLGLDFVLDTELGRVEEFSKIYRATMDRIGAESAYYYSDDYFRRLKETLGDGVALALVLQGDDIAAAALFLRHADLCHYHLAGADEAARSTGAGTYLVYCAALAFKDLGARLIHLGGGTSKSDDDTLLRFKRRFGGPEFTYYTVKRQLL